MMVIMIYDGGDCVNDDGDDDDLQLLGLLDQLSHLLLSLGSAHLRKSQCSHDHHGYIQGVLIDVAYRAFLFFPPIFRKKKKTCSRLGIFKLS